MSGILLVYTGPGKGKTSAAIGAVVRTLGSGGRVAYVQFMKGAMTSSERDVWHEHFKDRVLVLTADIGFFKSEAQRQAQQENALELWRRVQECLTQVPPFDLIVLDELNCVLHYGLLDEQMVLGDLAQRGRCHVVVTGRDASEKMMEMADTVSELREIKHAFQKGNAAILGIDY